MIPICFILFLLISILTSSYGQVTCASGWIQYGGSCYLFILESSFNPSDPYAVYKTWDQCNAYCAASYPGATMLCVNDAAENSWIVYQELDWMWIGYTDMPPYGGGKGTKQYGWVTGCSSTYTNWETGQPDNNGNNQDYAAVYGLNYYQWIDYGPQDQLQCGCEYNPALTTTPSSRPTTAPSYPSTVPSFRPTVAQSSGSTSSPTATPSCSSSEGSVSE
jgi:hypothetical protein